MRKRTWHWLVSTLAVWGFLGFTAGCTEAATIWNGPRITFTKLRGQNETLPQFQDAITPRVWLTRGNNQGIYNIRQESRFTPGVSPVDTEWAFGTTADLPNLKFRDWLTFHGGCPPCLEGKDTVLHLISEDIYIDFKVISWPALSGDVTYERATQAGGVVTAYAVEYYHSGFKHYFLTADPAEATSLDLARAGGSWTRTGQAFPVLKNSAAGTLPVCRFFSAAFAPLSSHFYTVDPAECARVKASSWVYEGNAFYANPVAGSGCATGAPLYRLYNNGAGGAPNHRFTTCTEIRDRMVEKGWIYEGIGMCVAGDSFDCKTDTSNGVPPSAPLNVLAVPGNANISLTFSPPASDGGLPITSYTATCRVPGIVKTATNKTSPVTVRGLPNGVPAVCSVVATNDAGDGAAANALATPVAFVGATYNDLAIPPLATPTMVDGTLTYDLTLAPSSRQYQPGAATNTYSYNNAGFWGPTIVVNKGDTVRLRVTNALAEETTTHWHGLLLPGSSDGGPHSMIAPGTTWSTQPFEVKNNASLYWYHPHLHMTTQKQLTLGAGGFIIVRDKDEAALALPRTYGVDDIPLTLTSRRFGITDGVPNQLQYTNTSYGDVVFGNGTPNPQFTLPKQMVRLRLLNTEIERDYNIGFNDGRTFYVIGNDGGLLSAPVPVTELVMAPAERYEILVDLTNDVVGSSINLEAHNGPDAGLSDGFAGFENATTGALGSLLNHRTFTLLHINVGPTTAGAITALPSTLVNNDGLAALTSGSATQSVQLAITGGDSTGPFAFNGLPFDPNRIDQQLALGVTAKWTVGAGNIMSHSFHIHGVQFRIVARNGNPGSVKPWERGWKDTFYLPIGENVTFVGRFAETAGTSYPYMYHCHMLNHEDDGLMGQFTVR